MRHKLRFQTAALCVIVSVGLGVTDANAGPLLDWLFGHKHHAQPAYPVGQPVPVEGGYATGYAVYPQIPTQYYPSTSAVVPGYSANYAGSYAASPSYAAAYGTYYGPQLPAVGSAGAGYTVAPPSGVTATTMPSTLSYVPNYRTGYYRAPVTYYRPLMTTDPATGAQVVALAPCTSYEYQTSRVPTFGRRALFGSSLLPQVQPAPQALPTYTLPSGGIPLASSTPNYPTSPYTSAYGGYSSLQPQTAPIPSTGQYPTSPSYGSTGGGGCTGSFPAPAPVPGLSAPQAPGTIRTPAPTWGQPTTPPGSSAPGTQGSGVYPSDPRGSEQPSLPPGFNDNTSYQGQRPELQNPRMRSIERYPAGYSSDDAATSKYIPLERQDSSVGYGSETPRAESDRAVPRLLPIPAPDDFELTPGWNSGLMSQGDLTASATGAPDMARYAGQSTRIHWASFEETRRATKPELEAPTRLRPIKPVQQSAADRSSISRTEESPHPRSPQRFYDSSGWRSSR